MFRLFHEIQVNGLISRNLYVENLALTFDKELGDRS